MHAAFVNLCFPAPLYSMYGPRILGVKSAKGGVKKSPRPTIPYKDNPLRALANKNMALCQRADSVSYFSASRQNLNYVRVSAVLYCIVCILNIFSLRPLAK